MAERNKATEKPPSFGEKLEHSKFVLVLMLLLLKKKQNLTLF